MNERIANAAAWIALHRRDLTFARKRLLDAMDAIQAAKRDYRRQQDALRKAWEILENVSDGTTEEAEREYGFTRAEIELLLDD